MMIRLSLLRTLGLLALIAMSSPAGLLPAASHANESGETVRIIARLQDDGDIEFGLRTSLGNQLPRQRVFSAAISDEKWRRSSIVELSDGTEVRIIARRDGETQVEFGLRIDEPRREFLPTRRFFPRSATVGSWLQSSQILLSAPDADERHEDQSEPEQSGPGQPEDNSDASDSEATDESSSVERISGGHRDGLAVIDGVLGDPNAPVLITEYGDPF